MPDALKSVYDLAKQQIYQIHVPLSRWKEDQPFTFRQHHYESRDHFAATVEQRAFLTGASYLSVERINDTHVAVCYANPGDYQELTYAVGGDLPDKTFKRGYAVGSDRASYLDAYINMLKQYCAELKIEATFTKRDNVTFDAEVTGLANTLHILAVHRKSNLLLKAVEHRKAQIQHQFTGKPQTLLPPPPEV